MLSTKNDLVAVLLSLLVVVLNMENSNEEKSYRQEYFYICIISTFVHFKGLLKTLAYRK